MLKRRTREGLKMNSSIFLSNNNNYLLYLCVINKKMEEKF